MAHETNLFTTSVSWGGQETLEAFLKPLYMGVDPLATRGIKLIPNVPGKLMLNLFDVSGKKTKAYSAGFSGSTGDTYTQKTLQLYDMKAEAAFSGHEFKTTVFHLALQKGYQMNDITGTVLQDIIMEVWMRAVKADLFRQVWLGDTAKTTGTTYWSATADTNYNAYSGIWKTLMTDAATTTPSATGTHIYRKAMDHGAVAQVATLTLTTGSSGNLVLDVNGVAYSQAYATSLAATATAFYTSHAANILAKHHITLTNPSSAALVFTSTDAGVPFTLVIGSGSGITGGSTGVVATTANTAPSALSADEALTYMKDLTENAYAELVELDPTQKTFYVDHKVYYNLLDTLEDSGTYTELGKTMLMDGVEGLSFRGIPIVKMNWNSHLAADFPANYYDEGRIILTANDNIVIGLNGESNLLATDFWYEKKDEQNYARTRYEIGVQYYSNKLTAVSY